MSTSPDKTATSWTSRDLALRIAELADDRQAVDTKILYVGPALQVTDYFVITTGRNKRHLAAIAESVAAELKKTGLYRIGGGPFSNEDWVLIDYASVVLHVFAEDARERYDLENLWGDCDVLEWTPPERPEQPSAMYSSSYVSLPEDRFPDDAAAGAEAAEEPADEPVAAVVESDDESNDESQSTSPSS